MNSESTRRELLATLATTAGVAVTAGAGTDAGRAAAQTPAGTWPAFGYDPANTGHNAEASGVPADPGPGNRN
jgi:hypothetical protein